jgi:hypothetical protein
MQSMNAMMSLMRLVLAAKSDWARSVRAHQAAKGMLRLPVRKNNAPNYSIIEATFGETSLMLRCEAFQLVLKHFVSVLQEAPFNFPKSIEV